MTRSYHVEADAPKIDWRFPLVCSTVLAVVLHIGSSVGCAISRFLSQCRCPPLRLHALCASTAIAQRAPDRPCGLSTASNCVVELFQQ